MKVHFWGTRGSLPASVSEETIREKITEAIRSLKGRSLSSDADIEQFVGSLPFSVRGSYGTNTSCMEITGGEDYIICDAGTGLRDFGGRIMEGGAGKDHTFHIFLSHLHWDHIQGFPFFCPAYIPGNRVNIYGCHGYLERAFTAQQNAEYFPVPLKAMGGSITFTVLDPGRQYSIGGFSVKAFQQNHPGDSYGYRFEREGKSIIYSTDSEHKLKVVDSEDYPFIAYFRDADLLVFDAQYSFSEAVLAKEDWGHSNNLNAVELSVRSGVKHLCMYHIEPTVSDEKLDEFLENTKRYLMLYAQSYPLLIDIAYDGLEIEV